MYCFSCLCYQLLPSLLCSLPTCVSVALSLTVKTQNRQTHRVSIKVNEHQRTRIQYSNQQWPTCTFNSTPSKIYQCIKYSVDSHSKLENTTVNTTFVLAWKQITQSRIDNNNNNNENTYKVSTSGTHQSLALLSNTNQNKQKKAFQLGQHK